MIEIKHHREMKGEIKLPCDPELFFLSAVIAYVAESEISVKEMTSTPLLQEYVESLSQLMDIKNENGLFFLKPLENDQKENVRLKRDSTPLFDFVLCLLLAKGRTVILDRQVNLDYLTETISAAGCVLQSEEDSLALSMSCNGGFNLDEVDISFENLNIYLGICLGLQESFCLKTGFSFQSPLRDILPLFGYEFSVKSDMVNKKNDPLTRRLELMKKSRKKPSKINYTVKADFSLQTKKSVEIDIPGDSLLMAVVLLSKSLVHKGDFILQNVPLEPYSSYFLTQIRKMGCKPGIQETKKTSYGSCGMVNLQKFSPSARKTDCGIFSGFPSSLPPLLLFSCFTKGKSIFRNLKNVYHYTPDFVDNIISCIELTGGRYGEMDDGIIVENPDYHDGFDLKQDFGAAINGSCAALACASSGSSTIEDQSILMRWPQFISYFNNIEKILT